MLDYLLTKIYALLFIRKILYYKFLKLYYDFFKIKVIVYPLTNDYFFDIFKPIYFKLKKNKKIRVFFVFATGDDFYPHTTGKLKFYLSKYIKKTYLITLNLAPYVYPDLIICSEIHDIIKLPGFYNKFKKIQMYHGAGVYCLPEQKHILVNYDAHFSPGPEFTKLIKLFYFEINKKPKIYNTGFSKTDFLFNVNLGKENFKKVIAYLPHWTKFSSIHKHGEQIIKTLSNIKNARILIKPHNHLLVEFPEWKEKLRKICNKYENVDFVNISDPNKLYVHADIVVTDTGTTAGFEASILKKPLIIFYNKSWFKKYKYVGVEKDVCDLGFKINSLNFQKQLPLIINKMFSGDKIYQKKLEVQKKKQEKLIKKYLYNPGNAAEKSVSAIYSELKTVN